MIIDLVPSKITVVNMTSEGNRVNTDLEFTVAEKDSLVDTKLDIKKGDKLVISASGQIWAGVWFTGKNGPKGWDNISNDNKFPMIGVHPYCLLGKLDGKYFEIGDGKTFIYQGSESRLYLEINDDVHANGDGAFQVHIEVWRR